MKLQTINPNQQLDGPASWSLVKYWSDLAAKFQHASVAAQVMAGFALLELQKQHGTNQGKRSDLGTSPHDAEKLDWPDLVKKQAGISDDTARRWMLMANGIRAKWKKLAPQERLKTLMAVSPAQWNEADTKLVCDSLHKVADGSTQLEFMRELGLAKKISRGTGREPGCDNTNRKLSLSEEAALRKQLATEDWTGKGGVSRLLRGYADKFVMLADDDVLGQIADLELALNARKAWLKQPHNRRNATAIAQMFAKK